MKKEKEKEKEKPLSLVTGACGFIGSHMVEVLTEAGHRVRATDLSSSYERDDLKTGRFPSVLKKCGVEFIPADITDATAMPKLVKGVDYVFHIASVFNYSAPWEVLYRINVGGTQNLCRELLKVKSLKRMVLWGAGGVYGLPTPSTIPFTEELAPNPPNNYQRAKWQQEYYVSELGRTDGLPYTTIRPTSVYGPRAVYGTGQMFMDLSKGKVSAIPANVNGHVPMIHVRDVAGGALYLARLPEALGETYNFSDDSDMEVQDLFEYMAGLNGQRFVKLPPIPLALVKGAATFFANLEKAVAKRFTHHTPKLEADSIAMLGHDYLYSNAKLKATGYPFEYPDARVGVKETLEWYREQGWL